MRISTQFGIAIFKIARKVLSILGHNISLSNNSISYPELTETEKLLINRIHADGITMTSIESLHTLAIASKYLRDNKIEGDVVETGVWRGGSALICASFLRSDQELYLYDTFSGMTKPGEFDYRIGQNNNAITLDKWKDLSEGSEWVSASINEVIKNFKKYNLLSNAIKFVEGNVEDTLKSKATPDKVSLVRIDTDFYASTKVALEIFWPKLSKKGILILDDYGHWDGARRATDEYFQDNQQLMIPISGGGGRIIVKI